MIHSVRYCTGITKTHEIIESIFSVTVSVSFCNSKSNTLNLGTCVDDHWKCHFLAINGECSKDPWTHGFHCKKSCNKCDVVTNPGQGRFKVS
jgi:hypothetical protein